VRTYTLAAGMRVDVSIPADAPLAQLWPEHEPTKRVRVAHKIE
jgi:hypothetical protein